MSNTSGVNSKRKVYYSAGEEGYCSGPPSPACSPRMSPLNSSPLRKATSSDEISNEVKLARARSGSKNSLSGSSEISLHSRAVANSLSQSLSNESLSANLCDAPQEPLEEELKHQKKSKKSKKKKGHSSSRTHKKGKSSSSSEVCAHGSEKARNLGSTQISLPFDDLFSFPLESFKIFVGESGSEVNKLIITSPTPVELTPRNIADFIKRILCFPNLQLLDISSLIIPKGMILLIPKYISELTISDKSFGEIIAPEGCSISVFTKEPFAVDVTDFLQLSIKSLRLRIKEYGHYVGVLQIGSSTAFEITKDNIGAFQARLNCFQSLHALNIPYVFLVQDTVLNVPPSVKRVFIPSKTRGRISAHPDCVVFKTTNDR